MVLDSLSCYLAIDKGAILAPLSILVSALMGSTVACWAVLTSRRLAKLKNSMDFINSYNEDKAIAEALKEIKAINAKSTAEVQKIASHNHDDGTYEQAKHIMRVLNYYEAMALCIHRKIYDETIIKEAVYTTVTDIWRQCQPYVDERRKIKNIDTYYQELKALSEKWLENPLEKKEKKKKLFFF